MLKLRDVMTTELVTVSPQATLREAADLLARHHVGGAPVLDGTTVVGVVSATDLLEFLAASPGAPTERPAQQDLDDWNELPLESAGAIPEDEPAGSYYTELWEDAGAMVSDRIERIEGPEWSILDEFLVDEVMTRNVITMQAGDELTQAADLMRRAGVHRVLVKDGDRLAGVVTTTDIVRAVADHHIPVRTYVFNRGRAFDERR